MRPLADVAAKLVDEVVIDIPTCCDFAVESLRGGIGEFESGEIGKVEYLRD